MLFMPLILVQNSTLGFKPNIHDKRLTFILFSIEWPVRIYEF